MRSVEYQLSAVTSRRGRLHCVGKPPRIPRAFIGNLGVLTLKPILWRFGQIINGVGRVDRHERFESPVVYCLQHFLPVEITSLSRSVDIESVNLAAENGLVVLR